MNRAVFFDRDGVINELVYEPESGIVDSPLKASQVSLVYGIVKLIKAVKDLGFITVVCSNQPSVGLGKTTLKNFNAIRSKIKFLLKTQGAQLDLKYYCMHHPFAKIKKYKVSCNCRKPKIGLLKKAVKEHNIDLSKSWMIGDGVEDVIAGKNAGCKTILLANINSTENLRIIERQLGKIKPDFIIKKIPDSIEIIKKNLK